MVEEESNFPSVQIISLPMRHNAKAKNLSCKVLCSADTRRLGPEVERVLAENPEDILEFSNFHIAEYHPFDKAKNEKGTFYIMELWFKKG